MEIIHIASIYLHNHVTIILFYATLPEGYEAIICTNKYSFGEFTPFLLTLIKMHIIGMKYHAYSLMGKNDTSIIR